MLVTALLVVIPITVDAAQSTQVSRGSSITSARWSVVVSGSNQSTANTSYLLTWTVSSGSAYHYFTLLNQGTVSLSRITLAINQVRNGGSGNATEVFFELCSNGSWNLNNNTCTGNLTLLGSSLQSSLILQGTNLPIGAGFEVRARTAISGRNNFSTFISPLVNRADTRSSILQNS